MPARKRSILEAPPYPGPMGSVGADDFVEHLALVLAAIAAVERLGGSLAAVDLEVSRLRETLLLAEGQRDGAMIALAAIVAVQLLAGEQAVVVRGQRRLVSLGLRSLRRLRCGIVGMLIRADRGKAIDRRLRRRH